MKSEGEAGVYSKSKVEAANLPKMQVNQFPYTIHKSKSLPKMQVNQFPYTIHKSKSFPKMSSEGASASGNSTSRFNPKIPASEKDLMMPFFIWHMLLIVDLSYTSVRELPSSFFNLGQLRQLYLKGCEYLMKLPQEIGKLQKLEKLDLEETQIIHLPKEFQQLTNMQTLILYFYEYRGRKNKPYSSSTIIPSGVISKLKGLKHLSIDVNPDDERWHENVRAILPEILGLECLQTLSIYIPHLELLKLIPPYIFEGDFRFIVGCHKQRIISSIPPAIDVKFKQSDRSVKFVKGDCVPAEIKMLLRHSNALFLDRHLTVKNLSEFELKNLEQLQMCILAECKEMQTIVEGGHPNGNDDMLSHLLFLSVSHMKNLGSICEGPSPPCCLFGMLQYLSLENCPKLMILFTLDFLGNLSLLEELIVKDCPKLCTLISHESSKYNTYTFLPKLRKLSLLYLPELTSISSGLPIGPGLKEMAIYDCPKLCSLSRNELLSKELVAIKGEIYWWKALKDRPSELDQIFSPIHEEADVVTQFGIYHDDSIDNDPGSSVGNLLQPGCWSVDFVDDELWSQSFGHKRLKRTTSSFFNSQERPTLRWDQTKLNASKIHKPNDDSDMTTASLLKEDLKCEVSNAADVSSELGIAEEAENTTSSDKTDPQPATVGGDKKIRLGGLQIPRLIIPGNSPRFNQLGHQFSEHWSTVGPRIEYFAKYPVELIRQQGLEMLNLSPKQFPSPSPSSYITMEDLFPEGSSASK